MHVNDTLNDNSYVDWSQEMNFLFAKNKVGFVDGTMKMPEEKSPNLMLWKRCDAIFKGWLTTSMEKEIRNSVKYANTATEMWKDLEERFGKESAPCAYELKRAITMMRQEKTSVSAYYRKLRGLWDEIQTISPTLRCICGNCTYGVGKKLMQNKQKKKLHEFLMGLDDSFGAIETQILTMNPTQTLGLAYHMVSEDEQQKLISAGRGVTTEAAAFQTFSQRKQTASKEVKFGGIEKTESCAECGKTGHIYEGCF